MNWIHLSQDRDKRLAVVTKIMDRRGPQIAGLIARMLFGEAYKSQSYSSCSLIHFPIASSL